MEKNETPKAVKTSYLLELAGNNQRNLYIAIGFSILSGFMVFIPYVMVFKTILFLFCLLYTSPSPRD